MKAISSLLTSRWLECTSRLIAAIAILTGAASWLHLDVAGDDLWWHLAAGRYVAEHGEIPKADPFSHTAQEFPWINNAWLWGRLFWAAYELEADLAAWLNLALLSALFLLVAWNSWRVSRSWLAAGASTWLVAAASHWFLDVRPHIVTLLLSAVVLAAREWRMAPWLWPPVMALWVNLHGGFAFGLGLLGLHVLTSSVQAHRRGLPLPRAAGIGLLCTVLTTGLNPWGFGIYEVPWEHFRRATTFSALVEWGPTVPSLDPRTFAGRFGWVLVFAMIGAIRARKAPFLIALGTVTAVMAISARRFIPLFSICAAPLVALGLGGALVAVQGRRSGSSDPRARLAASTAALLVAVLLWHDVRFLPRPLQRWTAEEGFPSGAATYLATMSDPPRRLFNQYMWGGYLMLHAPGVPVFIDGRAGTIYPEQVADDYLGAIALAPGWREKLDARGVDAALLITGTPLAIALRAEQPPWRVAHIDPRSILLFRPDDDSPQDLPDAAELLPEGADLQLSRGFRLRRRGALGRAATVLRDVHQLDPMQLFAYGELMLIAAMRGDAPSVRHWSNEAYRVYPRRRRQILMFAAEAWRAMGRCAEELESLRELRMGDPFLQPQLQEGVRARIREIEASPLTACGMQETSRRRAGVRQAEPLASPED